MENLEDIIYSRGITTAKKKLSFARKKPAKDNKKITFKSKKVEQDKENRKTTIVIKRKKIPLNIEELSKSMEKLNTH